MMRPYLKASGARMLGEYADFVPAEFKANDHRSMVVVEQHCYAPQRVLFSARYGRVLQCQGGKTLLPTSPTPRTLTTTGVTDG